MERALFGSAIISLHGSKRLPVGLHLVSGPRARDCYYRLVGLPSLWRSLTWSADVILSPSQIHDLNAASGTRWRHSLPCDKSGTAHTTTAVVLFLLPCALFSGTLASYEVTNGKPAEPIYTPGICYPKLVLVAFLRVQAWAAPAPGVGLPNVRHSGGQGRVYFHQTGHLFRRAKLVDRTVAA